MLTRSRSGRALPPLLSAFLPILLLQQPAPAQSISVQTPVFGVAIDAEGVLSVKSFPDPTGKLLAKRIAQARSNLPENLSRRTDIRKVSLVRLEQAVARRLEAGGKPDDEMRHLAGLQRLQYVFLYPEEKDIVIAGPAEGWVEDLSGRAVGLTTGRPTLLLEDLLVVLRAHPPGSGARTFIGCTIQPTPEGLAKMARFQQTIPRTIPQSERDPAAARISKGIRESMGMTNVRVFGVSDKSHFAQVLVEADYRMKLIGIGLEPPPVKMATYISELHSPRMTTLERWWFTPDYDCVKVTEDRLAMELVGPGVQLQGEDVSVDADGQVKTGGQVQSKASELYCTAFTRKYDEIAARAPVFAQLRNMIDLVIAAAFIRGEGFYQRADWQPGVLAMEEKLPVETLANPKQVPCAINVLWKGNRLLVPAGGVSIRADRALEAEKMKSDEDGRLGDRHKRVGEKRPDDRWWWD